MKLNGREATRFCRSPDPSVAAALIYGEDGVEVAERRQSVCNAWLGAAAGAEGLVRITGADQRRSPETVYDALKTKGFFEEKRVVWVEGATDGSAKGLEPCLDTAIAGEAYLIVTAGSLPARSKLRKLFEASKLAVAAPCYGDALGREDLALMCRDAGLSDLSNEALDDLVGLARMLDRGALRDLTERLALYMLDQPRAVTSGDVAVCAPGGGDAVVDDVVDAVLAGQADHIGPALGRVWAQGGAPVSVAIAVSRRLRQMQVVLAAGERDLEGAVGRLRPPVFGPQRDALVRRCRAWGLARTEGALQHMHETDAAIRGGEGAFAPAAVVERALLRLAVSVRR